MADQQDSPGDERGNSDGDSVIGPGENVRRLDIQDEMRDSYLTYAMSVIISRALPDARDGLKPSQRRILVAMDDLNLGPSSSRVKCAKISGDTSGNYHPHGDGSIYPTLVRMAQGWIMRDVLVDKQGNFGSLAGLPPAAMRYTEARLSAVAGEMLEDLQRDTVDYVPTYDQRNVEPVVLPSKFPNLLVNGSNGIAVGMATSIPPHNLNEVCDAVIRLVDDPEVSADELIEVIPGPDFPTGGVICGQAGIRQGYLTGRSTICLRAKTEFTTEKKADVIVVSEIPYLETRDRIREKLEVLVRDERIKGISRIVDLTDRNVPPWQVRLHIVLKRDADREVVLNQLFRFSPLQTTVSMILLALVGGRPRVLSIKALLDEFLRHRVDVIRRRAEFLLAEARRRKHTVEGLLIAQIDIDQIIKTIRDSSSRADAKQRLQEVEVPAELVARALGDDGFAVFLEEREERTTYTLTAKQCDAIISMQLGSLANLEREQLREEYSGLLADIARYLRLLAEESNLRAVVREDMVSLKEKYGSERRTEISAEEIGQVARADLITEESMVVTLSSQNYIKRTPLARYKSQARGGIGITGAKSGDEDPISHLFVSSTHSWLLFFSDQGKVHWRKVYDLPQTSRTARGRALINLLSVGEAEQVSNCLAVREFDAERSLIIVTRRGQVKKTALSAYSRPKQGGIIAIKLDEGDELVAVRLVEPGQDVLIATRKGMAIRFNETDARSMGRATRGVRGISLSEEDSVVGMVVAENDMSLLTVCENGFGKRTLFGGSSSASDGGSEDSGASNGSEGGGRQYRSQKRGGKGLIDIQTSKRNGPVIDIAAVNDADEVLMITRGGMIQRVRAGDIRPIGRNTQGVRLIKLKDGDQFASLARIPGEIVD
ncbi:MAG: DNA gyrase subunit A [Planctomycetaceae bacterium]|nr:DNA gyrase subunit A [Planctomycetaceae bacterium]